MASDGNRYVSSLNSMIITTPNQYVIRLLEQTLAEAKLGRIQCVMVLGEGQTDDGSPFTVKESAGTVDVSAMMLAFENWKLDALLVMREEK